MGPPIPLPALVVLIGPAGAGKSTWAAEHFLANEIVSSDHLRAVAGESEHDLAASAAAFDLLERIVEHRLRRRLTTVVDTTGLDSAARASYRARAAAAGLPAVAVSVGAPLEVCRARSAGRDRAVPASVIASQHRRWRSVDRALESEGWDRVVRVEHPGHPAPATAASQRAEPPGRRRLRFGLSVSRFRWEEHTVCG